MLFPKERMARIFRLRSALGFLNDGRGIFLLEMFQVYRGDEWCKIAEAEWNEASVPSVLHDRLVDVVVIDYAV